MIDWFKYWYRNRCREFDRATFWERIAEDSPDIQTARTVFMLHMDTDKKVYGDMSWEEKQAYVDGLYWGEERWTTRT